MWEPMNRNIRNSKSSFVSIWHMIYPGIRFNKWKKARNQFASMRANVTFAWLVHSTYFKNFWNFEVNIVLCSHAFEDSEGIFKNVFYCAFDFWYSGFFNCTQWKIFVLCRPKETFKAENLVNANPNEMNIKFICVISNMSNSKYLLQHRTIKKWSLLIFNFDHIFFSLDFCLLALNMALVQTILKVNLFNSRHSTGVRHFI